MTKDNKDLESQEVDDIEEVEDIENVEDSEDQETETKDSEYEEYEKKIELLESEVEGYRDRLARLQAEFENYKKRVEKEKTGLIEYGIQEMATELLAVIDNFDRALEVEETEDFSSFYDGVTMIRNQFVNILEKQGVTEIDAQEKPFDPNYHNAVSQVDSEEYEEGTVIDVYQKGYKLKDKVIRPSMVVVSK